MTMEHSSVLNEFTIDELRSSMESGRDTARSITQRFLASIEALDKRGPTINAVIEINPEALAIAEELDPRIQTERPTRTSTWDTRDD